ncbi:MAG: diacylglycerol kinase family lipid kinase [Synechococcales cyanobacterium C42_A2020_086]|jgi:diacylglycerol kinase (ATP)|nr:diacylglycerol kinase family lipid kinase [Synechococcales cyanobacterium M58_A2018_015]MBF2075896.1 diacylglycerol kinase family lipid kinase [Synechococcales cyanobacterium C42_A2020_086]
MQRARLIINPAAGDEQPNLMKLPEIIAAMEAADIRADLTFTSPTESPSQIAEQAVNEGYDLVVVGGGDGTVSEVAKGLLHAPIPLGIVPVGTYNNIARSLKLPAELIPACQVLAQGQVRAIDVGLANQEHVFFEVAGVGLDAALFTFGEDIKDGRWARLLQAAQMAVRYRPARVRLLLDRPIEEARISLAERQRFRRRARALPRRELRFTVLLVVIANGPYYGAGFNVAPHACLDDGLLTVSVFRGFSKWDLLRHFWAISGGQYRYSPKIETYQVAELHLSTPSARLPVHIDGNLIEELPISFRVVPQALRVLVPPPVPSTS